MIKNVIYHLIKTAKSFQEIKSFSDEPGIYALFFYGKSFPLENYRHSANEILYIGKTLKSQKSRDADTHFKTGKTGSSTLRKTFGSILHQKLKLVPIPRSQSDIEKRRYSHFKFENKSEEKLTNWMIANLGLSFYPYPKSAKEIDDLETSLINELAPILNIDRKNTSNPYYSHIRVLRKQLGNAAYSANKRKKELPVKQRRPAIVVSKPTFSFSTNTIHKYEDIWIKVVPTILDSIENKKLLLLELDKDIFDKVGNRKNYSFNLEFTNGIITNNIKGSAVARDLARVLKNNKKFKLLSKKEHIKFKMGNDFVFKME
jgi:hypothetical protein